MDLASPSLFTPWNSGKYSVAPNLRPVGADFGNGDADRRLILIDSAFERYRSNKDAAYAEDRHKYWMHLNDSPESIVAAFQAIAIHLATDYPQHYGFASDVLTNALTGEQIALDSDGLLDQKRSILPPAVDHVLEAVALQIQADVALIEQIPGGADTNTALHLCAPGHWAASDKIGQSFFHSHSSVPGFGAINAVAPRLVDAMINKGSMVRFVWGIESDDRLNHHPQPPAAWDPHEWNGRQFASERFWVRTERQTTLGLPSVGAALFFIHVQTLPDSFVLQSDEFRESLKSALLSMSPEARRYKGIEEGFDSLLSIIDSVRST